MATLSEHVDLIEAAIEAAEDDGFTVEATTCCCGAGLMIKDDTTQEVRYVL